MSSKLIIPFFSLLILFYSCKRSSNNTSTPFRQLISDTAENKTTNEAYASSRRSLATNLAPIENGVDSFELRIWIFKSSPSLLIVLRYNQSKWKGYKYEYHENDSIVIQKIVIPAEVESIISNLQKQEILNLPSQVAIPGFFVETDVSGAQSCAIEISTKYFYKGLMYFCPERFSNEPNHAKFINLINYLNAYFNFYEPSCKKFVWSK